ncbi:2-iminoacetate synthase ThiH [Moritella viscosa]|uniref:Thiamine biosynthesis protein ThiH n=1 Tax=Moritella viscosa TaxID=80854 RepID=A0ABY1HG06_9GAMM|nr:2-iminoacetate synthase ThiH [Moritella viscosa]CED58261.1 thiamine biosynthesis protein ThiH [Moritella viscosa]SGY94682.1 Thiamine biosynthesis protein ThiH [Moritella viscosa]SGZ06420.1 Thiamine biosynthesis protein ThiH [Moritella viscosa]SHO10240.1 Thiamine biosynthesis protein ThiH [Moritella viscosa]SHO22580.1 Thiamine biosynthesis protein ThiH [Moritella viscosa]
MSFYEQLQKLDWDDIRLSIYAKTAADVERALTKERLDLDDFQALISPAAEPYLEQMAQRSVQLTRQRFGNTIQFYVPLYLSNMCSNICTYCGFSMHNKIRRTTLDMKQLNSEARAIKKMGFDHLLLVAGESERKVGMPYFRQVFNELKSQFSHLSLEVQPLEQADYEELKELGLDSVLVYQETYHPRTYAEHHIKGKKSDFKYRIETPDRLGKAGIHKMGLGALIGLDEWRTDCFHVAAHLDYLQKCYWQTKYSISFPRLRPCEGAFQPKSIMNDRQLVQLICAYRLFNPDVELSLSTRESEYFRDNVIPLGITSISAGSKTQPGGYSDDTEKALEQFEIDDDRSPTEMAELVKTMGLEVVWKDWDRSLTALK